MEEKEYRPWLIQACTFKKSGEKISDSYDLHYMGSAEFEFGSVPKCLRSFYSKRDKLKVHRVGLSVSCKNKAVWVLCEESQLTNVANWLLEASVNSPRLKEGIGFTQKAQGVEESWRRDDFWFDITNDVAFSFDEDAVRNFMVSIQKSVEFMDGKKSEVKK